MYQRRGAYYFVRDGKWHPLGRDYGAALTQYAQLIGRKQEIHTVHDAVWHYIESSRARLAPATVASYEHSAARLVQVFGQMRLSDVLPSDVYAYLRKHGNVQANRDRALLSAAYSEARRIGAFPKAADDPTKGLEYRNPERPRDRYVTDAELSKVLAHASPKLATIARFIELTGMRPGDALRVRPGDVRREGWVRTRPAGYAQCGGEQPLLLASQTFGCTICAARPGATQRATRRRRTGLGTQMRG